MGFEKGQKNNNREALTQVDERGSLGDFNSFLLRNIAAEENVAKMTDPLELFVRKWVKLQWLRIQYRYFVRIIWKNSLMSTMQFDP